jgi:hypothetical protein
MYNLKDIYVDLGSDQEIKKWKIFINEGFHKSMYRLTSPDNINIIPHVCNTPELAEIVKNYIESRHNCTIIVEERYGMIYYDCPGSKLINPELYDIEIVHIKVRIDDLAMLCADITGKQNVTDRGFYRIASFGENICLSELELKECRDFIEANKELIDRWDEEADRIIKNHFIKNKKNAN